MWHMHLQYILLHTQPKKKTITYIDGWLVNEQQYTSKDIANSKQTCVRIQWHHNIDLT